MALSPQWLDELRARTSLSGLIRRTVKLQRAGNEWKACCPFHNENTPSFTVNDAKGFYHCFGCQAHGDAIRWLTDQRGLTFMDAVKELAAQAGLEVPAPDPAFAARAEQRATLHDVMQAAQDWFVSNLRGSGGAEARAYLQRRGFDVRTIERFGFGWAPDDRKALSAALERFELTQMVEAGLLVMPDADGSQARREAYDRFRGRIMLPIQDLRGRVIAFGGRILATGTKAPKYLNSPDTPLFDKGRTLYNLHRAGPASRHGTGPGTGHETGQATVRSHRIIVVEGYLDVIALAAAGIEEAVAPMGTALTEQQLDLLWRQVDKPVLCFDGDAAGQRAALKAVARALPLLQPGRSLEFVRLPAGLDPDDLIRRDGKAAMARLLDHPVPMLDMIWEAERAALPLASPEDKAGLKARLLAHVETIADRDIAALYRRELVDRFSAFAFPRREPRELRRQSTPWQRGRPAPAPTPPLAADGLARLRRAVDGGARDSLVQAVLAGLARHPGQIGRHAEALLQLAAADPRNAEAIEDLILHAETLEAAPQSPISAPSLLAPPPDGTSFSFLTEGHDPDDAHEDLAEAITLLVERPALDTAIAAATARFADDPEGAFAEQQLLRKRKLEIDSRLGQMARKRAASAVGEQD